MTVSLILTGLIISIIKGWLMTLVMIGAMPFLLLSGYIVKKILESSEEVTSKIYTKAAGIVEERFFAIKTIKSLNGESY